MADLPKIVAVLAKTEAVRMTDAVPTAAANAIRLNNQPRLGGGFLEENMREAGVTGRLAPGPRGVAGGRYGTVEIMVEARGLGAVYSNPNGVVDYDPLLRASALVRTLEGGAGAEAQVYRIADSATTCTLYLYSYTKLFKLVGCVGTARIAARAAQVPTITFTMTGVLRDAPTDAAVPALTLTDVKGRPLTSAAVSLQTPSGVYGFAEGVRLLAFDLDLGNTVSALPAAGAVDGHDGYEVTDRAPTLAMVLRSLPLATIDPVVMAREHVGSVLIEWGQNGTPNYNGISIASDGWEPRWPAFEDDNGVGTYNIPGRLTLPGNGRILEISTR